MNLHYLMKHKKNFLKSGRSAGQGLGYFSSRLPQYSPSHEMDVSECPEDVEWSPGSFGGRKAPCIGLDNSPKDKRPSIMVRNPKWDLPTNPGNQNLKLAMSRKDLDQNISRNKFANPSSPNRDQRLAAIKTNAIPGLSRPNGATATPEFEGYMMREDIKSSLKKTKISSSERS